MRFGAQMGCGVVFGLMVELRRFDMEKGVEKILLERQVAKDRGTLGAVNVAVWHRSVVHEPKKDLEKRLPDRVAKKCVGLPPTFNALRDCSQVHDEESGGRQVWDDVNARDEC